MILGSYGMLGHMVFYYLKSLNKYEIVDASFPEKLHEGSKLLNVKNATELEDYLLSEKPEIIINCIGVLIQGSMSDPSNAIYLNAYYPHQLSKISKSFGGKLIHISTDCVFSGDKGQYTELDTRNAYDTYGMSKALGEVINDKDVTLRTSIIGPELKEKGEGLLHWYMQQTGNIKGYSQAFWGGVTTLELAKVIDAVINQNIVGLMHVTNGIPISKYELLNIFTKTFNRKDIQIEAFENKRVDKSLKSVRTDFYYNYPTYEIMIDEMKSFLVRNRSLYHSHYKL